MKKPLYFCLFAALAMIAVSGCNNKAKEEEPVEAKEEAMERFKQKEIRAYDGGEKIVYKTYDGKVLKTVETTGSYSYEDEIPERPSDERYHYDFAGWDITYDFADKATVAKAKYEKVLNEYEVRFVENGEIVNTQMVTYGEMPVVPEGFVANESIKAVRTHKTYYAKAKGNGEVGSLYLIYELSNEADEWYVMGYTGNEEHVVIPSIRNGLPVTTIETDSFITGTDIKSIYIPNTIKNIEPNAFRGIESLDTIELEDENPVYQLDESGAIFWVEDYYGEPWTHLTYVPSGRVDLLEISNVYDEIDDGALTNTNATIVKLPLNFLKMLDILGDRYDNNSIKQVIITQGHIRSAMFKDMTELYSVTIKEDNPDASGSYIAENAFEGCINLRGIALPSFITEISYEAFKGCTNLEDVVLSFGDMAIESFGKDVFEGCDKLKGYLNQGVLFLGNETHKYQIPVKVTDQLGSSFVVPADTLVIPDRLFYKNQILEDVDFSQCTRLKSIGEEAFYQCLNLDLYSETHCLPETLEEVGYKAFASTKYDESVSAWLYLHINDSNRKYCMVNLKKACTDFELGYYCKFIDRYGLKNGFDTITNPDNNPNFEAHKTKILIESYHFVRAARSMTTVTSSSFQYGNYPYIGNLDPYCCYNVGVTSFGYLASGNQSNYLGEIGEFAFYYSKLDSNMMFGTYIRTIGSCAFFYGIKASVTLNIPNYLLFVDNYVFYADYRFTLKFKGSQIPDTWDQNFDGYNGSNTNNTYLFNQ